MTSAMTAEDQTVATAPVARAATAASHGRTPTRPPIAVRVPSAIATHTADSRFARQATEPSGSSSNAHAVRTYVGYPVGWVTPRTWGTVCISPQSSNAAPGISVAT